MVSFCKVFGLGWAFIFLIDICGWAQIFFGLFNGCISKIFTKKTFLFGATPCHK
jgi:hypothetical protein